MSTNDPLDDNAPLVAPGTVASPADSLRLVAQGGAKVRAVVAITGKEKFEHMVLFCLNLLQKAQGKICAFYIDDFPDCDEHTLKVVQHLIGRAGFTTSDFLAEPSKQYKGFWAWRAHA